MIDGWFGTIHILLCSSVYFESSIIVEERSFSKHLCTRGGTGSANSNTSSGGN